MSTPAPRRLRRLGEAAPGVRAGRRAPRRLPNPWPCRRPGVALPSNRRNLTGCCTATEVAMVPPHDHQGGDLARQPREFRPAGREPAQRRLEIVAVEEPHGQAGIHAYRCSPIGAIRAQRLEASDPVPAPRTSPQEGPGGRPRQFPRGADVRADRQVPGALHPLPRLGRL